MIRFSLILAAVLAFPVAASAQHPIYQGGPSFPDVVHLTDVLGQPGTPITLMWDGSTRWTGTDATGISLALEPGDRGAYFVSVGQYRWSFGDIDGPLTVVNPPKVVFGIDRIVNGRRVRRGAPYMAGPIMGRYGWTLANWSVAPIPTFIVTP